MALRSLFIENFIIIDHQELSFKPGLTVITGETGSGKSLICSSLEFALGARPKSFFKDPRASAYVKLVFEEVMVERYLLPTLQTRCLINGLSATIRSLQDLCLVYYHKQGHFSLSLEKQRIWIDRHGGLESLAQEVHVLYDKWSSLKKAKEALYQKEHEFQRHKAYLEESLQELKSFEPIDNEEDCLLEKRTLLKNKESLSIGLDQATGILEKVSELFSALNKTFSKLPHSPEDQLRKAEDSFQALSYACSQQWRHILKTEGENIDDIEERLFRLRSLARKYATHPNQLYEFYKRITQDVVHGHDTINSLKVIDESLNESWNSFYSKAIVLAQKRQEKGKQLVEEISQKLPSLKLEKMCLRLDQTNVEASQCGVDQTEIFVCPNPGSSFIPLAQGLSGGENARMCLAFQSIGASFSNASTLVFDEIDQGTGGATAFAIGHVLQELSKHFQVIVVSHSPQVAACADHHIRLEKVQDQHTTHVKFSYLENVDERIEELSRMLSGKSITEEARQVARKLLENEKSF